MTCLSSIGSASPTSGQGELLSQPTVGVHTKVPTCHTPLVTKVSQFLLLRERKGGRGVKHSSCVSRLLWGLAGSLWPC